MERTPKDALMESTRTVISGTWAVISGTWAVISSGYSLLKESYVLKEPYVEEAYVLKEPPDPDLKDPLRDPDKAFDDLAEIKYRAELELVDRYQSFVAELLRLSLAGIAVVGFLFQYLISSNSPTTINVLAVLAKVLAAFGVLMFGISAAFALVFRFFAAEGARFYIEALRFTPANADGAQKQLARKRLDIRDKKIRICRTSKAIAAGTLALGGVLEAAAFALLLLIAH
jgi:hypothetical protein